MRYRDLARRLHKLGCRELREGKGSHRVWHNPATGLVAAVPDWGSKDLAPGTVRAVIRELGIDRSEFGPIK
ncbi:MAG: type II toxin-antitoxin system HicA family toxin [Chloroflexi bacterium]|nr:type II toxin-antitoxin system HicA family toxin [Chloroflexota bacterium]MBU1750857.1 type II toxin-antitoxin system HicA family toxin [Chloroflexota bacterium]MBU1879195.1 type II toxin-antitoxin system HicA family toxin [Chloroflexota bacterium]